MRKSNIKTILVTSLLLIIIALIPINFVKAESLCPSYMDPNSRDCLNYLRKQLSSINTNLNNLEKKLKDEQYQQLSLRQKIDYITKQISETEKIIEVLRMEIAAKDVEITILSKEIQTKEDDLNLLNQEIAKLKETVNKRVSESYKYSFISPFEVFLNVKNLESILRKTKYLLETRSKDKISLAKFALKSNNLKEEEDLLSLKKLELQQVRNSSEEEKIRLDEQKIQLDSQKAERTILLAESEKKETALVASFDANRAKQASIDDAIMRYVQEHGDKMAEYGWVKKGDWIGKMDGSPNGCSTGYHIHFSIDRIGSGLYDGFGAIDPWAGYLTKGPDYWRTSYSGWKYFYIRAGSFGLPLGGTVVLTQDYHSSVRKAIDIYSLNGYGADVYAAMEGDLSKSTDKCGDTYAVIKNVNTGIRTAYYHLQ